MSGSEGVEADLGHADGDGPDARAAAQEQPAAVLGGSASARDDGTLGVSMACSAPVAQAAKAASMLEASEGDWVALGVEPGAQRAGVAAAPLEGGPGAQRASEGTSGPSSLPPYGWGANLARDVNPMAQLNLADSAVVKLGAPEGAATGMLTSLDPVAPMAPTIAALDLSVIADTPISQPERPKSAAVARPKSASTRESLPSANAAGRRMLALPLDLSLDATPAGDAQHVFQAPAQGLPVFPSPGFGGLLWGQPGGISRSVWQQPPILPAGQPQDRLAPQQPPPPHQQQLQQPQASSASFYGAQTAFGGGSGFGSGSVDGRASLSGTPPLLMPQLNSFGMGAFGATSDGHFGQIGSFGQLPFVPTGKQPDWSMSNAANMHGSGVAAPTPGAPFHRSAGLDAILGREQAQSFNLLSASDASHSRYSMGGAPPDLGVHATSAAEALRQSQARCSRAGCSLQDKRMWSVCELECIRIALA